MRICALLKSRSGDHHSKKGWFDEMLVNGKMEESEKEWGLCQWVEKIGIVSVGAGKTL